MEQPMRYHSRELSSAETRRIGTWPWNRLQADSEGRGWQDVHASVATVNSWTGVMEESPHHCIAFCVSRPAFLRRRVDGHVAEQMTLRPRQFFLIPAHRRSEWERRGQTEMLMIYLRQEMLDQLADESGSLARDGKPVDVDLPLGTADPFLEQFALEVLGILRSPDGGTSAFYVNALGRAAAAHLLRRQVPGLGAATDDAMRGRTAPCTGLRRARAMVEADPGGDLSLEAMARETGLPVNVFGRRFRQAFGITPHQYVLEQRLQLARALLASTDLPIGTIALEAGFASQSHFTTAFRRRSGIAPASFRRSV